MTVGETLVLMARALDFEGDLPEGFKAFYKEYKKKCIGLKLYSTKKTAPPIVQKKDKLKKNPSKEFEELPDSLQGRYS